MTDDTCQRYAEDPELYAAHREDCAHCQEVEAELEALDRVLAESRISPREGRMMAADGLPLAGWEGASHRAWPVVIVAAVFILLITAVGFLMVGVSPVTELSRAAAGEIASGTSMIGVARRFGTLILRAPVQFHVILAVLFVAVNAVLYFLLRRAPRGIDV